MLTGVPHADDRASLQAEVVAPEAVRAIDLVDRAWPPDSLPRPEVRLRCLSMMSVFSATWERSQTYLSGQFQAAMTHACTMHCSNSGQGQEEVCTNLATLQGSWKHV